MKMVIILLTAQDLPLYISFIIYKLVFLFLQVIILFYFILFYFILFYFILFYFILFYFILFYFILFYFILFYFILFYFILLLILLLLLLLLLLFVILLLWYCGWLFNPFFLSFLGEPTQLKLLKLEADFYQIRSLIDILSPKVGSQYNNNPKNYNNPHNKKHQPPPTDPRMQIRTCRRQQWCFTLVRNQQRNKFLY